MRFFARSTFICGLLVVFFLTTGMVAMANPVQDQAVSPSSGEFVSLFQDVPAGNSNALFINYLAKRGLVKGFPDGNFHPNSGLTRAEAAALLIRSANLDAVAVPATFSDINGHWAAGSIAAAASAGLVSGYPDGTFHPDVILTRDEGVALFLRLSKQPNQGVELPALEDLTPDHWAARPVTVALAAGMAGLTKDKKQFLPDAPFTRSDMARVLGVLLTQEPNLYQTALESKIKVNKGKVSLIRDGNAIQITNTTTVNLGDTIKTSPGAEAELTFPDGTGILLKEKTELVLKEAKGRSYITSTGKPGVAVEWLALDLKRGKIFGALATRYQAAGTETKKVGITGNTGYPTVASLKDSAIQDVLAAVRMGMEKGALVADVKGTQGGQPSPWWQASQQKRVKVKVDMPWGVAAVRGTFWENTVNEDGSSRTTLLTGEAELTANGQTVQLTAGQAADLPAANTPPTQPAPMTTQDKKEWAQEKAWAQERAEDIQNNQESQLPLPPPALTSPPPEQQQPVEQPQPVDQQNANLTNIISAAISSAEQSTTSSRDGGSNNSGDNNDDTDTTVTVSPGTVRVKLVENVPDQLPLENKTISFYLRQDKNGDEQLVGSCNTDSDGITECNIEDKVLSYTFGQAYYIVARFLGDSTYNPSKDITEYRNTELNLGLNNYDGFMLETMVGQSIIASVNLTGEGTGLSGEKVELLWGKYEDNGQTYIEEQIATLTTDSGGQAGYDLTSLLESKGKGYFTIMARFLGSNNSGYHSPTGDSKGVYLKDILPYAQNGRTILQISDKYDTADASSVRLEGSLVDGSDSGKNIAGKTVNFFIIKEDGEEISLGSALTEDESVVNNVYKDINTTDLGVGCHRWKVTFDGDEDYSPVTAIANLNIGGVEFTGFNKMFNKYDSAEQYALQTMLTKVADDSPVNDQPIDVYIRMAGTDNWSGPYNNNTDNDGRGTIIFTSSEIDGPGRYEVKVNFNGIPDLLAPAENIYDLYIGVPEFRPIVLKDEWGEKILKTKLESGEDDIDGEVKLYIDLNQDNEINEAINGEEYIGTVTASSGTVILPLTPEIFSKINYNENYRVMAIFDGNESYAPAREYEYLSFSNTVLLFD